MPKNILLDQKTDDQIVQWFLNNDYTDEGELLLDAKLPNGEIVSILSINTNGSLTLYCNSFDKERLKEAGIELDKNGYMKVNKD